jgi:hypothetical protein
MLKVGEVDLLASVPTSAEFHILLKANKQYYLENIFSLSSLYFFANSKATVRGNPNSLADKAVRSRVLSFIDATTIAGFVEGGFAKSMRGYLPDGMLGICDVGIMPKMPKEADFRSFFQGKGVNFVLTASESLRVVAEYIKLQFERFECGGTRRALE